MPGWISEDGGGWYKKAAAGGGGPATFTFRGKEGQFFNPATTATFSTIDTGPAAADRYVIIGVSNQNSRTIDSVTVGGVSLTKDVERLGARGMTFFSKLVTTGSGVQTVVVTSSTGGIFEDVVVFCWTGTGMSNTAGAASTASAASATSTAIAVNSGDFLLALFGFPVTDSGSTQAPLSRTQAGGGSAMTAQIFEWTVGSTGSFNIGTTAAFDLVAVAYR